MSSLTCARTCCCLVVSYTVAIVIITSLLRLDSNYQVRSRGRGVHVHLIIILLLLLLYINDIFNASVLVQLVLFADDTNIFLADRKLGTVITVINKELKLITEWFRVNKLSINVNKTNFILFTSPRKNYSSHTVVDKILINDIGAYR